MSPNKQYSITHAKIVHNNHFMLIFPYIGAADLRTAAAVAPPVDSGWQRLRPSSIPTCFYHSAAQCPAAPAWILSSWSALED